MTVIVKKTRHNFHVFSQHFWNIVETNRSKLNKSTFFGQTKGVSAWHWKK